MKRFFAAVAFLTRVPIRTAFTAEDVGKAAVFYPVVGAGIGLVQLAMWAHLTHHLSSFLVAALIVTFAAWATRALHLDGLADFADGLGGGRSRDEVLRIMKDSRIGAFGAIAIVLLLITKVAAVDALTSPEPLVLAPALARWSPVVLSHALPYARPNALAPSAHIGMLELVSATLVVGGLVMYLGRWAALSWGAVAVVSLVVALVARRRVGGVTGDVLGANVELAETAALVVACL